MGKIGLAGYTWNEASNRSLARIYGTSFGTETAIETFISVPSKSPFPLVPRGTDSDFPPPTGKPRSLESGYTPQKLARA